MNINKYQNIALLALLLAAGCKQDVITLQETPTPVTPTYSKGSADFSKFVAIGNSLTSGFQAGALFTAGQENSYPLIMNKSFVSVGGSATFNQPDVNSVNGYNSSVSNPGAGIILGRFILFAADGKQADAVPTPAGYPGVPAPYNTADPLTAYTGVKSQLNNFAVPGILLGQVLTPLTGGPASGNPAFNPYYQRFASAPGTSSIIGDAIAALPTFFVFDLGNNDVLGYATSGGDAHIVPLTDQNTFAAEYGMAIGALMNPGNPTHPQGVVSTIPDVTDGPFFSAVSWNALPLDAPTATAVTAELATGYNTFLQGMLAAGYLKQDEVTKRTLSYTAGQNGILIIDTDLTDLTPFINGTPGAGALLPYARARQTAATDLVTLTAGSVIGTIPPGGNATTIYGVTVPLPDKYVLVPSEIDSINTYTASYNNSIKAVAAQYTGTYKIALADVNAAFKAIVTNGAYVSDGVTITATFTPPLGAFSEDGIHPNSRGYAFLANVFISAIETTFGATIPHASLADYAGVGLPLVP